MTQRLHLSHRALVVLAISTLVTSVWQPSDAGACSCLDTPRLHVIWPYADLTDVPRGASVVVSQYQWPDLNAHLEAEGGTVIPLEITRTLEPIGICSGGQTFLRPTQTLAPNTKYTLRADESNLPSQREPVYEPSSFTTSADDSEEPPFEPLEFDVFYVDNDAHCDGSQTPGQGCLDMADIRVESPSLPRVPHWIRISSSKGESGTVIGENIGDRRTYLAVASHDDCLTYTRYDGHGEPVEEGKVCEHRKCAVSRDISGLLSVCGGLTWRYEVWEDVAEDSCKKPPRLVANGISWDVVPNDASQPPGDDNSGGNDVDDDDTESSTGGNATADGKKSSGSCSVGRSSADGPGWLGFVLLGLWLTARRHRVS